jgi:hypothetical protein
MKLVMLTKNVFIVALAVSSIVLASQPQDFQSGAQLAGYDTDNIAALLAWHENQLQEVVEQADWWLLSRFLSAVRTNDIPVVMAYMNNAGLALHKKRLVSEGLDVAHQTKNQKMIDLLNNYKRVHPDGATYASLGEAKTLISESRQKELDKALIKAQRQKFMQAMSGHKSIEVIKEMLRQGADINCLTDRGFTPLMVVITRRDVLSKLGFILGHPNFTPIVSHKGKCFNQVNKAYEIAYRLSDEAKKKKVFKLLNDYLAKHSDDQFTDDQLTDPQVKKRLLEVDNADATDLDVRLPILDGASIGDWDGGAFGQEPKADYSDFAESSFDFSLDQQFGRDNNVF